MSEVVTLTDEQKDAVVHALREAYDKTQSLGGNQYGPLALEELTELRESFEGSSNVELLLADFYPEV